MSEEIKKLTEDLIDYAKLVIVAMFLIVLVYLVAQSLFGMVPAVVGSVIIGIAFFYIYSTNKKIRQSINSWLRSG